MGGGEAVLTVEFADGCFDAGGVTEVVEEVVGGEVGEPFCVHGAAFAEDEFARVEGEDSIADPCEFAFDLEFFVACHGGVIRGWDGRGAPCAGVRSGGGVGPRIRRPSIRVGVP